MNLATQIKEANALLDRLKRQMEDQTTGALGQFRIHAAKLGMDLVHILEYERDPNSSDISAVCGGHFTKFIATVNPEEDYQVVHISWTLEVHKQERDLTLEQFLDIENVDLSNFFITLRNEVTKRQERRQAFSQENSDQLDTMNDKFDVYFNS